MRPSFVSSCGCGPSEAHVGESVATGSGWAGAAVRRRGSGPAGPASIWFPVGGGVENGETLEQAAIREVKEETGLLISDLGPVVMTRHVDFTFEGDSYDQDETYYAVTTAPFVPDTAGWTKVEQRAMSGSRWWTVDELRATSEIVFPEGLSELVERVLEERPR